MSTIAKESTSLIAHHDSDSLEERIASLLSISRKSRRLAEQLDRARLRQVRFAEEDIYLEIAVIEPAQYPYGFSANLALYFDDLEQANYSVEEMLLNRGVIDKRTSITDTEQDCFCIYFTDMKAGSEFIYRLNAFLDEHVAGVV
jgi:ABC-type molybdate transport system substrate-binding protein